uniref:Uncharacterized protein n=1 Tax=Phlebotomus papatasi TaxID=29031 RepID=A0A1B0DEM9_PHLPP
MNRIYWNQLDILHMSSLLDQLLMTMNARNGLTIGQMHQLNIFHSTPLNQFHATKFSEILRHHDSAIGASQRNVLWCLRRNFTFPTREMHTNIFK